MSCLVGRGDHRAVSELLIAWLGQPGPGAVAVLFALWTEKYTTTSCFLYSYKCPVHRVAPRAGLTNQGIQQAGRQNWIFA